MLQKITNNILVRGFMALPLWAKIVVPIGLFFVIKLILSSLFGLIRIGLIVALVAGVIWMLSGMGKKKR